VTRPSAGSSAEAAIAIALLCLSGCGTREAPPTAEASAAVSAPAATQEEARDDSEEITANAETHEVGEVAPLTRLKVTVYFPSSTTDGLQGERREIFQTASPVERVKQILSDLIEGPSGPDALPAVPKGTRLKQVFVLESGQAYVDFSSELKSGLTGGTDNELLTVYAIVNSIALHVPEIRKVTIPVDGEPCVTLSGHLDLRRPLVPQPSLAEAKRPEVYL